MKENSMKKPNKIPYSRKLLIEKKLERILINLDLKFKKLELPKNDCFYIVNLESLFNELENLDVLLSFFGNKNELLVLCPNIYKLKKEDSTLSVLSALNKANLKLAGGTVTLSDDGNVVYRRVERFDRADSLTKLNILNIFNDIIASIIYTTKEIKDIRKY